MEDHILFEARPGISVAVLPDVPRFTIVAASSDFIHASGLDRSNIIGKGLFDLATTQSFIAAFTDKKTLSDSFQYVIENKKAHELPQFRYNALLENGSSSQKYRHICSVPISDPSGELRYIIYTSEDITKLVGAENDLDKLENIKRVYKLLMRAPAVMGIFKGKDHILQLANNEAFKLWGQGPEIIGKPLREAIPEIQGQEIIELFDQVYDTGETHAAKALPVKSFVNGIEEQHYFDIECRPVFEDGNDHAVGVFTISNDVTGMVAAQKKLEEKEERLYAALQAAHMGTWDISLPENTMIVSDEVKKIFGLPLDEEFTYDVFINSVLEEDREYTHRVNQDIMQLKDNKAEFDEHYRIKRANDGKVRWVQTKGKISIDKEGKPYRFTGVILDVTPQKEAEERFRNIFESVPVAIVEKDYSDMIPVLEELKHKYGDELERYLVQNKAEVYRLMFLIKIVDVNKASVRMFDAERKEELLKGLGVVFTEDAIPAFIGELMAIANREKSYKAEYMLQTLTGRKIPCLTTMSFPKNQCDSVLVSRYDISDIKKAEQELRESEERFRIMANSIPQLAWMTDKTGFIYWYNDRWYSYTGTTPEEMLGWGWRKAHHPDMVEGVVKRFKEAIDAGREWEDIFLLRGKNGKFRWFLSRAVPVRDENHELIGWFGTNTDITDQRKTEYELKKSEEQLLLAIQGAELGVYDYYPNTGEMAWSKKMKEFFGLPANAPVDYDIYLDSVHPEDREKAHQAMQMSLTHESGGRYENEYRVIADGKVNWLRAKGKAYFDEHGKAYRVAGVSMDITRQKEAEEALRQSEQLFRTLSENLPQLIWVTNAQGVTEYTSQRWTEYVGTQPLDTESLQQIMHPDDWRLFYNHWQDSLQTGKPFVAECRLKSKKGKFRWFALHGEPVRDEKGKIEKWIGAYTDIDDQKTFAKRLEKLVIERTKELKKSNEELQRFVHVSSHDFKEPVRKITLFTGRLEDALKQHQDKLMNIYMKTIRTSALRLAAILEGVLKYSAVNFLKEPYRQVNLNEVLKNVEADLKTTIQEKNAVINYINLPTLRGASDLLHLVFYNLISNSLKFAKADVPPVINITSETVEQKGKTMARILFQDNGIGFNQNYADKIFGTFTRLESQDAYEGVGLGLSLCKKIIEQHGGSITAEGTENIGATFQILLPLKDRPATVRRTL